jgi:hypothetical protein
MPAVPGQALVVAFDQDNQTVEPVEVAVEVSGLLAKAKIAQVIDQVGGHDDAVPIANEFFVHRSYVSEWTVAVFDDVGVTEMRVASKENFHRETWANALHHCQNASRRE